jgi:hypothetical protein
LLHIGFAGDRLDVSHLLDLAVSFLLVSTSLETLDQRTGRLVVDRSSRQDVGRRSAEDLSAKLRFESGDDGQLPLEAAHVVDG